MAKLLLVSDTHGTFQFPSYIAKINSLYDIDIDAFICMGDVYEMDLKLLKAIADGKDVPIYGIPGNHEPKKAVSEAGITDFHGKVVEIKGVKIAGIGGCPRYNDNNLSLYLTYNESAELIDSMDKADILISHASSFNPSKDPVHRGLPGIDKYIKIYTPSYHFYGHNHNRDKKEYIVRKGFKRYTIHQRCVYMAILFDTDTEEINHLF